MKARELKKQAVEDNLNAPLLELRACDALVLRAILDARDKEGGLTYKGIIESISADANPDQTELIRDWFARGSGRNSNYRVRRIVADLEKKGFVAVTKGYPHFVSIDLNIFDELKVLFESVQRLYGKARLIKQTREFADRHEKEALSDLVERPVIARAPKEFSLTA